MRVHDIKSVGIVESQKVKKDFAPQKKVNTRGVLKVDGYSDFNPDLNVQLRADRTSVRQSVGKKQKGEKSGCCK